MKVGNILEEHIGVFKPYWKSKNKNIVFSCYKLCYCQCQEIMPFLLFDL